MLVWFPRHLLFIDILWVSYVAAFLMAGSGRCRFFFWKFVRLKINPTTQNVTAADDLTHTSLQWSMLRAEQ